jgi:DNA polymerase-3 subunit alpha
LGITEIDPMKHGLIFERFLNPERVSLPDIDIDFDPVGRMKVLDYVAQKYGAPQVAQCTTYGTIKTKQALKDAARIMGYDFSTGERLTKALPGGGKNAKDPSLKDLFDPKSKRYAEGREFRELYETDPDAHKIIDRARGIEGLIRQTGVHACATIMADIPITDISPLMERSDGTITTVFEYHTCETLGLVKNDFLGLSNLTTIHDTLANIKANKGESVDITKVPLDDKATYRLLSAGSTLGVFQLDSDGMRSLLKQLKPDNFNDISALIALYRPGPMDMNSHINYAKRKNGEQPITPIDEEVAKPLAPVLDETYGLIVYQEQVQSAARILAGYSLGEADVLRRAMGKKKPEVLAHEKVPFFKGMAEHGYSQKAAQDVWDILVPFSGYAFNKAHSACYGLVSYWTAYLKTHYPVEFMAALLEGERTNKDKTAIYLAEARRMNIKVLIPDVNESVAAYSAVGSVVRFGLGAIRNVGEKVVEGIVAERKGPRGLYKDFLDFIRRVPLEVLNKRAVESLIKGGAFDSISPNRRALFTISESAIDQVVPLRRKEAEGQFDLFSDGEGGTQDVGLGDATITIPDIPEWDKRQKLNFEREVLGLYVSDHPLSGMSSILAGLRDYSIAELIERAPAMPDRSIVTLSGMITKVERRTSKSGNPWALVTIEDLDSSIDCLFFGRAFQAASSELVIDKICQIRGMVSVDETTVKLRAMDLNIVEVSADDARPLDINIGTGQLTASNIRRLYSVLRDNPGMCPVTLVITGADGATTRVECGDMFRVTNKNELVAYIKTIFGVRSIQTQKRRDLTQEPAYAPQY